MNKYNHDFAIFGSDADFFVLDVLPVVEASVVSVPLAFLLDGAWLFFRWDCCCGVFFLMLDVLPSAAVGLSF